MLLQWTMAEVSIQKRLESDLVKYLESLRVSQFQPNREKVKLTMLKHFPDQSVNRTGEDYLIRIGISHIFQVMKIDRNSVISCSVTDTESKAQEQLQRFSHQNYKGLRNDLGIDSHWVFLVPHHNICLNSRDEFIDCFANYEDDGRPDCWITDVY